MAMIDTILDQLPSPLGGGAAVGAAPTDIDVMVDQLPFWLAIDPQQPYQRETAQYQRQQVDQQPEAGEQSLAGWWTRSQMSFHFGAGLKYLDSTARPQPEDRLRFDTCRNVNPWTPGQLTRLNGTTLNKATPAGELVWLEQTDTLLIMASQSKVSVWNGTSWTDRNYGSANPILAFCIDGANYYAATTDGVWKDTIAGATTATKVWNLPGTSVSMCLGFAKQRLMLGMGAAVYVLDVAGPTLPTPKMTHPVSTWVWTKFFDGPSGIMASGYAGLQSCVYNFGLTDVSGVPTLGAGLPIITLPTGERVLSAVFYIGSLLVLGTNRGIRVCVFSGFYGTTTLGPLVVLTEAPVTALAGFDRYVWGGTRVNGETALVRVDLSAPLDNAGHYAWSPDLVFPTGTWSETVSSINFTSTGSIVAGVQSRGVVFEGTAPDDTQASWLQTAKIRMGTVEDKDWPYASVRGTVSATSTIQVDTRGPGETNFSPARTVTANGDRFGIPTGRGEWLQLRFTLASQAVLNSYQVQALPAGRRQRLISLPLWVGDYQITRSGVEVGYPGFGKERMDDLEILEATGTLITVMCPALFDEAVLCVIERMTYVQAHDPGDQGSGTGGALQLVLRTTS